METPWGPQEVLPGEGVVCKPVGVTRCGLSHEVLLHLGPPLTPGSPGTAKSSSGESGREQRFSHSRARGGVAHPGSVNNCHF